MAEFYCIVGYHCKINDFVGIDIFSDCTQNNFVFQSSYR